MVIKREDLGTTDFSGLTSGRRLAPVHPGRVLLKEFMEPLKLSSRGMAKRARVPQRRIDEICAGRRGISADTARRLGRFFGVGAALWMNLQTHYDLEAAGRAARAHG